MTLRCPCASLRASWPFEEIGAQLVILSSKTGERIAAFDFRVGKAPVARFGQATAVDTKAK